MARPTYPLGLARRRARRAFTGTGRPAGPPSGTPRGGMGTMVELSSQVVVTATAGPLSTTAADAVRALAQRAAAVDGVAPLSEQPLLWLTEREAPVVHLQATADDGTLAGYAQLDVGSQTSVKAELVVDPARRRTGVGRGMLARARAEAEVVDERDLRVWAHGDLSDARAFARSAGMVVVREL